MVLAMSLCLTALVWFVYRFHLQQMSRDQISEGMDVALPADSAA